MYASRGGFYREWCFATYFRGHFRGRGVDFDTLGRVVLRGLWVVLGSGVDFGPKRVKNGVFRVFLGHFDLF